MSGGRFALSCALFGWLALAGCSQTGQRSTSSARSGDALERVQEKGPVKLVVRLSPKAPRLSDLVQMEIEVTAKPEVEIKSPTFGQAVGDFLVRDYTELSQDSAGPGSGEKQPGAAKRFRYQLEPVHSGTHLIRSVAIDFVDNRLDSENRGQLSTIESEPIEVQVTSELAGKVPNLTDLSPMLPPRPLSQSRSWMWLWFGVPVAVLASLVLWLRRRRKTILASAAELSPGEIAHHALAKLLAENLPAQSRFQEFYLRLTGIVRCYIEGTTGVRAPEQTTEEFLSAMRLRNLFRADQAVRLKEFLEAADMVKYAGQQPNSEQIELSILRAREFVETRSLALADPSPSAEM